ncbi:hypothetical protein HPP92_026134 [Vanilla planifolia]|uniref:Uncharacterized protein n=1 Tax=Vanilla planifolia TaxID=51239 RepID=A0A835U9Y9_VANPL|nr:hypothetical protein HPP92_026134 [Vanilla planifolia]
MGNIIEALEREASADACNLGEAMEGEMFHTEKKQNKEKPNKYQVKGYYEMEVAAFYTKASLIIGADIGDLADRIVI